MNMLYNRSDFNKLFEERNYQVLGSNKDDVIKILTDLEYNKIPIFYRNSSSITNAKTSLGGLILKLSDTIVRSPMGTNKNNLDNLMNSNPDFPDRRKSIFMRTANGSGNTIVIPYKDTKLAFCPTYDFNQELLDDIIESKYDKKYIVAINNYFLYTYKTNKPRISKVMIDIENLDGINTINSNFYKTVDEVIKKLNLKLTDSSEELFKYFLNLKNFGFYIKLGSELTSEDFKKNVEVWTEGPVIIIGIEQFVESKLPQL